MRYYDHDNANCAAARVALDGCSIDRKAVADIPGAVLGTWWQQEGETDMERWNRFLHVGVVGVILSTWILTGCEKEANRPPVTGTISGQVTFSGTAPESGDIQVSAFATWDVSRGFNGATGPPSGWTEPLTVAETVTYEITGLTVPGTYQAVAAGWRDPNVLGSDVVLGMYGAHKAAGDSSPVAVILTEEDYYASGIDFVADFGELNGGTSEAIGTISGTIHFSGTWPADQAVYVIAGKEWPLRGPGPMYGPLPQGTAVSYAIPNVPLAQYKVVGAWTYPAMTFLGGYGFAPAVGDTIPDPVTISVSNPSATDIDFEGIFP